LRLDSEGSVAEFAKTVGTDVATFLGEAPGMSALAFENGVAYRTYSAYARGIDLLNTAYNYLDIVPKGRDEGGRSQYWVRRHDEY